ncbi:MAG: AraC family transcriptional regulator [Roseiarcus sp.]|uniref:AraC family transcriptional regulator n=1 Tax=Roseiarcus sp. TaxID=1969460 RepID=UPI003BAFED37
MAAAPLLRRAGLSERALAGDSDVHPMSDLAQARVLDFAAEAMEDSAFGLHLALQTDPRDAGIFFYVASGAKNLGEALSLFARYFRIVNEAVRLRLTQAPAGTAVEAEFVGLPRHEVRQNAEFGIAVILKALREITGRNIRPERVAFAHPRNADLREFERFYGCPVEFGRAANEGVSSDLLNFSNETLAIPLITADAKLLEALQPFCDMAAKERNTSAGTLRAAVENEVEKLLPQGKANARAVAKALALSVRTLSRRLAAEGTAYAEVVDQLRRSLALQYLKEPGMSLSQIAWLLGYEGSTSFNHAFKRWTGRSPSAARNQKQLPPLAPT